MSEPQSGGMDSKPPQPQPAGTEVSRLPNGYYLQLGVPEEETNILDLWEAVTSRKLLIFLVVLGFTLFTFFLASAMPKQYLGEVVVMLVPTSKDTSSSTSDEASVDLNMEFSAEEIMGMIQGREFLYRFIRDHDMLPILFEKDWNKDKKAWQVKTVHRWIYGDTISVWDGYGKLNGILDVSTDEETGLTTLSIKWTDPKLAADWANMMVDTANRQLRDRAIRESETILAQLDVQLRRTSAVELQQALYGLMETQMAKIVAARVHPEFVMKVVDRAVVPEDPAIPYLQLILTLVGLFLGLIMALSLVLLLHTVSKHRARRPPSAGGKHKRKRGARVEPAYGAEQG
jgi:uncharacterized protein involved in exopolysaccharide biosynthesis